MVARRSAGCQTHRWKRELAAAFTRPEELLEALNLDRRLLAPAQEAATGFRLLVPRGYAALMERGNPHDPLLRQALPLAQELEDRIGFSPDPVGDRSAMRAPGLLQKYQGRALLVLTGACAIHCRYCFRRHFPYAESATIADRAAAATAQIAADSNISEVILSGGDPLMLDDEPLAALIKDLEGIAHLKRLRLHTRLPIVLPARITATLRHTLTTSRLQAVVVVHANHARELGEDVRRALGRLRHAGIPLLNQSVLLRGVNDRAEDLVDLSERLFDSGVLPYYLHLLDKVSGAAHFEVPEESAVKLMDRLRTRLPGYLVPRLVKEEAGRPYKIPVL
ncbi:MAG: EF-P beta-lysylation protein EpmB [Pseudomonadota bacterium]|nr:EF-P beta-lysylation protein EpmB [Pseudomonadota bacterium]